MLGKTGFGVFTARILTWLRRVTQAHPAESFKNRLYSDIARMEAINRFRLSHICPFHNELAMSNLVQQLRTYLRKSKATAGTGEWMFRAQLYQLASGPTLKMEGSLVGEWAQEAKSLVTNGPVPKGLIVDLTDVSYVDSVGEHVLAWLASVGACFMAKAVYAASVCERLQLPLHGQLS